MSNVTSGFFLFYKKEDPGPGSSNPTSSSYSIGIITSIVVAAMVVIIVVILIVCWFLYRRKPGRKRANENTQNINNIKNPAYEGDPPVQRRLPQVPSSNSDYEEPAEYQQLDSSKRVSIDANYQSLIHKNKQASSEERGNENDQRHTSLRNKPEDDADKCFATVLSGDASAKESIYEEIP